jgi:hypothetical protein
VIWLASNGIDGATGNTIENLNVEGNSNTTTLFGIGSGGATVSLTSLGNGNHGNTIRNNRLSRTQYGIYAQGASAASKNTGTVITQNLMTAVPPNNVTRGGIQLGFDDGAQITENRIEGVTLAFPDAFGITLGLTTISTTTFAGNEVTNATVERNIIGNVTSGHDADRQQLDLRHRHERRVGRPGYGHPRRRRRRLGHAGLPQLGLDPG